jgi:hypothetical protein
MHGFAFNVTTDLNYFQLIVPVRNPQSRRHLAAVLLAVRSPVDQAWSPAASFAILAMSFERQMIVSRLPAGPQQQPPSGTAH